jgi:DNA polymerase-3 subunit delta
VVAEGRVSTGDLVGAARSVGMFSARRVVLLRDVAVLEGPPEPLEAFAASAPSGSFLIVRAPKLDRNRKLHQAVASGTVLEFRAPATAAEADALVRELVAIGKERGQILDRDAAAMLAESCRGDLLRALREVERLRDWSGASSRRWTREEIAVHLAASASGTGWEVADALVRRDRARGLAAVREVLESGAEPIPVVGGLAWRARVFLAARARVAMREPVERVVTEAGAWGWNEALREGIRRWPMEEALRVPARLLRADRELKSRGIPGSAVLESIVEDLAPEGGERR